MTDAPDALGDDALPPAPSPETLRLALIYVQRDIRQLRADVADNGRLDEGDRQLLAALDERTDRMLTIISRRPVEQLIEGFKSLFGLGDNARRPWVWVLMFVALLTSLLVWYARDTYVSPEVRSERVEAARVKARADSLREARAYELELRRLSQPSTVITVPDGSTVAPDPSPDSSLDTLGTPSDTP